MRAKKGLLPALKGTFWMISSTILFSFMSVLVRVAADSQGISALGKRLSSGS